MEKEIKLERRTEHTNSCISAVDDSIVKITIWKLNNTKYYFLIFLYSISFGSLYIVRKFYHKIFIFIACDIPQNQDIFDYVLIQTDSKDEYVVQATRSKFDTDTDLLIHNNQSVKRPDDNNSQAIIAKSIYIDEYIKSNRYNYVFFFKDNKYIYIEERGIVVPVHFQLTKYTNEEIVSLFKNNAPGIPTIFEFNYLLKLYGLNRIYLETKTATFIFVSYMFEPLYIYNLYGIINWIITEYYIGAIILGLLTLLIQIIRTCLEHRNYDQLNSTTQDCCVRRPYLSQENIIIQTDQVVPGDIVFVSEGSILPFDGLILEGIATVSESDLTGECSLVLKGALENTVEPFSFEGNEKSILFQGSKIIQCQGNFDSAHKNNLMVLVFNTGFNTNRGNLIQNFQIKKTTNFSLSQDFIKFAIVALGLWSCSILVLYFFNFVNSTTVKFLFDNFTILLPPCISISMGFCSFYFLYTLMRKGISCIESNKMLVSGAVNTIIFDKTGTLTRYDIEMKGCMVLSFENNILLLKREDSISTLNKVHKLFWKRMSQRTKRKIMTDQNYQYSYINLPIFFTECLASCHCVDLFNEEPFGNSIDKMLYNIMRWHLAKEDHSLFIIPSNPFKISSFQSRREDIEDSCFGQEDDDKQINCFCGKNEYKLQYLYRSEFSSKNQSMCVIVCNSLDNSIRLYSKGAPEKMVSLCIKESLPTNFGEEYVKLTQSGMRVLSCCTRLISEREWNENAIKIKKAVRETLEKNLIFLGFVIFSNKLKNDTKKVIGDLINANCKIMISTGDNPYTTISVAKECEILKENKEIFIIDFEDNKFKLNRISFEKKNDINSNENLYSLDNGRLRNNNCKATNIIPILPNTYRDMQYEILFSDVFLSCLGYLIHNDKKKVCVSGHSLSKLIELASQRGLSISSIFKSTTNNIDTVEGVVSCLIKVIKIKGIIFFRMLPYHKAQLIKLLKKDMESIILMCGDGANDCNAIMASDVGIAIRQPKNQCLISHFYSSIDSIICVERIIQNGRACYENHIVLFKAMILGGVIQLTGTIILMIRNYYFAPEQFAFFDFICSVIPVFLATNGSSGKLGINKPYKSIINKSFVINVVGETVLQVGFQFLFQQLFAGMTIDRSLDIPQTDNDLLLVYPSVSLDALLI